MLRQHLGRPAVVDAVVGLVLVVVGLIEAATVGTSRSFGVHVLLTVVVMGAVAVRRRAPLVVQAVVVFGTLVIDPDGELAIFVALVLVSYTCGAELDPPRTYVGLALAVGPMWTYFLLVEGMPSDFAAIGILYGGSWLVGRMFRDRARRSAELAERVVRAERDREAEAARAVAEERARIARELHDVVSHSISVIAVQTQAVRRRLGPDHAREVDDLRAVETTARQAMAEMRRLFGVLRAEGERASLSPQPGLDQLDRLIGEMRGAGFPVELSVQGEPVPLPPGLDLAAYRVVQEALTNVRKHAPGGCVRVCLYYGERHLELAVDDTGGTAADRPEVSGYGLVGMRERVTLYGGTLETGSRPGGGFTVRARLPFRAGQPA